LLRNGGQYNMFYNKWCYFFDTSVLYAFALCVHRNPHIYIGMPHPPSRHVAAADLIKTGFPGNNNIIIIIIVIIIYIEMAYGVFNPPARTL